jgi:hypothetical protein
LVGSIYGKSSDAIAHFVPKIFRNRPIRNKNCLWWPGLLMDRDEMSTLYREPPIDDTYQVSVHLAKRFQRRRFFRNQPIRNKNCLWWPCLLTDRYEMSMAATSNSCFLLVDFYCHHLASVVCKLLQTLCFLC